MAKTKQRYRIDILQGRRERVNKSIDKVAAETGFSTRTIRRALSGENLEVDKLIGICEVIGLEMKHIFDFDLTIEKALRANGKREP
jgi:transcriptional regulator with XRE-family HTH domain